MLARLDPLALLERPDKWYLGGGQALVYAPPFPRWLDTLGFWDEAHFADIALERLFCLLLLDARARPLVLRRATRRWTPDRFTQIYTIEGQPGLQVQEERVVTGRDTLACRLTITNARPEPVRLHVLLWSLQTQRASAPSPSASAPSPIEASAASSVVASAASVRETSSALSPLAVSSAFASDPSAALPGVEAVERDLDSLHFCYRVPYQQTGTAPADVQGWGERTGGKEENAEKAKNEPDAVRLYVALGGSRLPDSWTVNLAEPTDTSPLWQTSLFPEKFGPDSLAQEMETGVEWKPDGHLHLALHYGLEIAARDSDTLTCGASVARDRQTALANLGQDMAGDALAESRADWQRYFASVPYFECDDPFLETAYWYRWYGLRLSTVRVGAAPLSFPCVFEGIGGFRAHISYSAPAHIRETLWMHDPALAMGSLENFLASQTRNADEDGDDGLLPGHLYLARRDRGFYHADWGTVALRTYLATGDRDFVRRTYPGLVRYAEYFDRERDKEHSGLYDVRDQGETGQEYMSRYLFADAGADWWGAIQVKGVDATCYQYALQRTLAIFARALGQTEDADWWDERAESAREAVRVLMWDGAARLFKDVHPRSLAQSPYKAAVGFYPFLTDVADNSHLSAWAHLNDPATFGTPFPLPASSQDDPCFSAQGDWKGKRMNCPWNGRAWPMATAHVAEALARAARTLDPTLRPKAADFIRRFVKMLFFEGDPKRPNCFEHYNPLTGTPSLYRGVDDYQHSWVVDLLLQNVAGVQIAPGAGGAFVIDPLPFGLERFRAENIALRGHRIDVSWSRAEGFVVAVDGRERVQKPDLQRVEISL